MSNTKENKNNAAEKVALLQKNFDDATALLNALPETATEAEKAAANAAVEKAQKELEKATKTDKKVKVKFLKSPTGKYKLAYSAGDEVSVYVAEAAEMIESGFATAIGSEK